MNYSLSAVTANIHRFLRHNVHHSHFKYPKQTWNIETFLRHKHRCLIQQVWRVHDANCSTDRVQIDYGAWRKTLTACCLLGSAQRGGQSFMRSDSVWDGSTELCPISSGRIILIKEEKAFSALLSVSFLFLFYSHQLFGSNRSHECATLAVNHWSSCSKNDWL